MSSRRPSPDGVAPRFAAELDGAAGASASTRNSPNWDAPRLPRYLTPKEVAAELRWDISLAATKRRLRGIHQSHLPFIRIGRDRLYIHDDVIRFIQSRRTT